MPDRATTVFVSYSHADSDFVAPVVSLLRATRTVVFLDADTIRPGKKWRDEIERALQHADLVVVFWCRHSNASREVGLEYERALSLGKDILPVLLDSSTLPAPLSEFQYIDFQSVAGLRHGTVLTPRSGFSYWPAGLALAFALVAAAVMQLPLDFQSVPAPPSGLPGPPNPADGSTGSAITGLLVLVSLCVVWIVWVLVRRKFVRTLRGHDQRVSTELDDVQRELAGAIEAEVTNRLNSKIAD